MNGRCSVTGEYCNIDMHHIIPREYGGENGPTIALSPTVHQTLHRVCFDDVKLQEFISLYSSKKKLIEYLANAIRFSKDNFQKQQSNKVTITLTNSELEVLKAASDKTEMSVAQLVSKIVKQVLKKV